MLINPRPLNPTQLSIYYQHNNVHLRAAWGKCSGDGEEQHLTARTKVPGVDIVGWGLLKKVHTWKLITNLFIIIIIIMVYNL